MEYVTTPNTSPSPAKRRRKALYWLLALTCGPVVLLIAIVVIGGLASIAANGLPVSTATETVQAAEQSVPEPVVEAEPEPEPVVEPEPEPVPAAAPPPAPVPEPEPVVAPEPAVDERASDSAFRDSAQAERMYMTLMKSNGIVPDHITEFEAIEVGLRTCVTMGDQSPAQAGTDLMMRYGMTASQAGTVLGLSAQSFCVSETPTEANFHG